MSIIRVIAAETHTPEYLLHKYWARKPHNILSSFISELVPENGVVVDPFCGSGVTIHEAQKLNRKAYGFDINPIAVLITKVLIDPPQPTVFVETISRILDDIEPEITASFSSNGRIIKYCIHAIIAKCSSCGRTQKQSEAVLKGKCLFCNNCGAKLRINLENLVDTEVLSVAFEGSKTVDASIDICSQQKEASQRSLFSDVEESSSYSFAENRRILAFGGMTTKHLFTERNYSILNYLSSTFGKIEDEHIRDAAKLLLSASVAQCSRLIANRNTLSTGGPAWSIPGFWVPAIHLETNPIVHLRARLQKFSRGLTQLTESNTFSDVYVKKTDARLGLNDLTEKGILSDLIFFDPPYGDNVPYIEFSAIWNSFLRDYPDPNTDISVSDRLSKEAAWSKYNNDLVTTLDAIKRNLKPDGRLLITFNNNDMRAWKALLMSLQKASMECEFVTYQIPAVVSAKAQKSIESSYIGDIYSIFKKTDRFVVNSSLSSVSNALIRCAKFRGGTISKPLAQRTMIIAWIENNINAELLVEMEAIKNSLFEEIGGMLHLKGTELQTPSDFEKTVQSVAAALLNSGPCEWSLLYERTAAAVADYGIPDPPELRAALTGHVTFDGTRCIAFCEEPVQMSLFELQDL